MRSFPEQPGPILRAPLSNNRHNIIAEDASSVCSKLSNHSRTSPSASRDFGGASPSALASRFKLKSKPNDTPTSHGSSRRSRTPRPVKVDSNPSRWYGNSPSNSYDHGNGIKSSDDPFSPFGGDQQVPSQSVNSEGSKQNHSVDIQEWTRKGGQMTQGDAVRTEGYPSRAHPVEHSVQGHFSGNHVNHPRGNTTSSPSSNSLASMQESITLNRSQLERIIEDRLSAKTLELQDVISQQQKQISDLKFFQDLDLDKVPEDTKARDIAAQMEVQLRGAVDKLSQVQSDNTRLNKLLGQLREENLTLQANLQACNPPMSSSDAYKKALRLQSDLLDSKNLLQEEALRRERAETNLECFRLESENELKKSHERVIELEEMLKERTEDLDDGVQIMKSLEDEIESVQKELEKERQHNDNLQNQFEQFEKEKNLLAQKLGEELEASKNHLQEMENRFDKEKKELEEKCTELEEEVRGMKLKVLDMDEKKTRSIMELKRKHEEKEKNLQALLDEKSEQVKVLEEKINAMEEVVAMYHEKARGEIQEYAKQAEEAKARESNATEKLQEYISRLSDAEKEIEALLDDMDILKSEFDSKDKEIEDLQSKNSEITESLKTFTSAKAKEHQLMRDKRKWVAIEKSLREELRSLKEHQNQLVSENKHFQSERGNLSHALESVERENFELRQKLDMTEKDLDKVYAALEDVENESTRRIKALEQELVRTQTSGLTHPSRSSTAEIAELKNCLKTKEAEIRHVQEIANAALNEVENLRQQNHSYAKSGNRALQKDVASSAFDAFGNDDGIDHFQNFSELDLDEMDNMSTCRKVVKSPVNSVTPDNIANQRKSIKNDAVRSYMQNRRRQNRSQQ